MADASEWTIGRLLEWTKDYLGQHGSDSARLDAEVLLAHARGCQRIELYTAFDEVAPQKLRDDYRALVKQRAQGTPVAYLVGSKEFYSLPFLVNSSVLIPRPETEFLVIRLLDLAKEAAKPLRIVDVGTGSGIVAICAALNIPECSVIAIDQSEAALEVARQNAATHGALESIEFRHGDLLADCLQGEFDFVVSNPPYVSESEYLELAPQIREYEPRQALVGGPQGTELICRLVEQSSTCLKQGGWLLMEISPMICDAVKGVVCGSDEFSTPHITNDLAKLPRIIETQRV